MDIPNSTDALTKLLRSKDTTTGEIYDIVSQFDQLDLYFPNKEVFVLELIGDRWNDQKLVDFKKDYRIWRLYNDMWVALGDEVILKKLFKHLKFVPHLIKTSQVVDSDILQFLCELKKTCALVNSTLTIAVPLENAHTIMGRTLELLQRVPEEEYTRESRNDMIDQIKTLTDINNVPEVTAKISTNYCNELLLPTIQYITKFGSETSDPAISFLTENLGLYLFGTSTDTVKLLESFVVKNRDRLTPDIALVLFQKSISFMAKQDITQLEKIFSIIVDLQSSLSPRLLKELSLSKKTMSQEFLENLLQKAITTASTNGEYGSDFWTLIFHVLDLDIEIGIQNTDRLLEIISQQKDTHQESTKLLLAKIVNCHSSAREFPQFLNKWETYCNHNGDSSLFLLTDPNFTETISRNVSTLSVVQLKSIISQAITKIDKDCGNKTTMLVFKVVLRGLPRISYTVLTELKGMFPKVFEIDIEKISELWEVRYLIMEVFDDIVPTETLEAIECEMDAFKNKSDVPKELFYYFFKLREYKSFDISPIISEFMDFFRNLNEGVRGQVIKEIFINWSTLINLTFPKDDLSYLIDSLLSNKHIGLLDILFTDDNIFEEPNIMHCIVGKLSNSFENQTGLSYIGKIPLQCINKSIRIDLINNISSKKLITEIDMQILNHALANPTFKANIEKNLDSIYCLMAHKINRLTYENDVFEKIWTNHLSQMKEEVSINFFENALEVLCEGIEKDEFDVVYFQMAFLGLKSGNMHMFEGLKTKFVQNSLKWISENSIKQENSQLLSWLLRCLYFVFKSDENCIPQDASMQLILSDITKKPANLLHHMEKDLIVSVFLLYSVLYTDDLEYLFAHYLVIREAGVDAESILPGVREVINKSLKRNVDAFNNAFAITISSFATDYHNFIEGLLELYQVQIECLNKDNIAGAHLFVKSISEFYTNSIKFKYARDGVLKILGTIQTLLISKSWLFSQYCIEMLFPMCLNLCSIYVKSPNNSDDIFVSTTKLISNVLFVHRVKLSNRHHLVNALLCEYLELLSRYKATLSTAESARSLARLISNFCEPANISKTQVSNRNDLTSKMSTLKRSLRKYLPVLLVKYIHLSISSAFDPLARKELTNAMYSVFDLLSPNEVALLNGALDNAGRQYFRSLYTDYKKMGRWHAD